ncbi:MAG: transposase [Nitrospirota bacterium]
MHCLYEHSGALPSFLVITDGKTSDVRVVKETSFPILSDSIVSIDRAYIDYYYLNSLNNNRIWFVTRAKSNIDYTVAGQHPVTAKGVVSDSIIRLNGVKTRELYPKELRLIEYYDDETKKTLVFLTNNFNLSAA